MRRTIVSAVALCLCIMPAFADATTSAQGTVTFALTSAGTTETCSAPMGLVFAESNGIFALHEVFAAGSGAGNCAGDPLTGEVDGPYTNQGAAIQECVPVANKGPHFFPSSISQSGTTYTIKTPHKFCDGTPVTDTIVFTLGASSISYRHDITENGSAYEHIQGTLTRIS